MFPAEATPDSAEMPLSWGSQWLSKYTLSSPRDAETTAVSQHQRHGSGLQAFFRSLRRSLDVQLKNYNKIDTAFKASLRYVGAQQKLQGLASKLVEFKIIDSISISVVSQEGTFGVVGLSGPGSELYPPLVGSPKANGRHFSLFSKSVFQLSSSGWSVEDAATTQRPWYYKPDRCCSVCSCSGKGVPHDVGWLQRAGMKTVLALPCIHNNKVVGVFTIGSRKSSWDQLLLAKMEELCYLATSLLVAARDELAAHFREEDASRSATPFESAADIASAMVKELINLDKIVAARLDKQQRGLSRSKVQDFAGPKPITINCTCTPIGQSSIVHPSSNYASCAATSIPFSSPKTAALDCSSTAGTSAISVASLARNAAEALRARHQRLSMQPFVGSWDMLAPKASGRRQEMVSMSVHATGSKWQPACINDLSLNPASVNDSAVFVRSLSTDDLDLEVSSTVFADPDSTTPSTSKPHPNGFSLDKQSCDMSFTLIRSGQDASIFRDNVARRDPAASGFLTDGNSKQSDFLLEEEAKVQQQPGHQTQCPSLAAAACCFASTSRQHEFAVTSMEGDMFGVHSSTFTASSTFGYGLTAGQAFGILSAGASVMACGAKDLV